jgi:hypothetical protein
MMRPAIIPRAFTASACHDFQGDCKSFGIVMGGNSLISPRAIRISAQEPIEI